MLASGNLTFLFTDIEGSTKLWETDPERMPAALARHDALLRRAITRRGGCVFKTVGDAFCAAFSSASEALMAAIDIQLELENTRGDSMLLILDNCEHLAESCAKLAQSLLRYCQRLTILTTSRAARGVGGEHIEVVQPLDLPIAGGIASGVAVSARTVMASEAARLFVERAKSIHPAFVISDENAGAVSDICRRLAGIPFAIELAASRARVLSAEQIAARLGDRFRLLAGKLRGADIPRQQTLRATIDWSYDLLTTSEQTLLRRLSIFAGGWTLDAAETVCADETIESCEILDLIAQLVDKSLAFSEQRHSAVRYRMLETVREYAREKCEASGESEISQCATERGFCIGRWMWSRESGATSRSNFSARWTPSTITCDRRSFCSSDLIPMRATVFGWRRRCGAIGRFAAIWKKAGVVSARRLPNLKTSDWS